MRFRRLYIPALAMALGGLVTLIVWRGLRATEKANVDLEFGRRCQVLASVIEISLHEHQESLYNLRDLIQFSDVTTRAEFAGAARDIIGRHRGIQALEWAPRVAGAERAATEAATRAEGFPDFEFADRQSGPVLKRSPDRPEHFPVLYIEPYESNKAALGFDLVSGITWTDMQRAAATNQLIASGRLPLITDGRSMNWGYLLELPVYGSPLDDRPETRRERLRGFVLGVFQISEMLEHSIRSLAPQGVDVLVVDQGAHPESQFLHYHPSRLRATAPASPEPAPAEFLLAQQHRMIPVLLAGRTWELHFRPAPEWLAAQSSGSSSTVLAGGLLSSLILGFYLRTLLQRTGEVEKQVGLRTAELSAAHVRLQADIHEREAAEVRLRESEARLQAILDHSPALIFVKDLAGRYIIFNRPFAELCFKPPETIKGCTDLELFPAAEAAEYVAHDREVLAAGRPMEFEEAAVRHGKVFTNIVQKFPLVDAGGRAYALCGIATDITERKRAEAELQENRRQLRNLISQLPGAAFRCLFDENLTTLFASEGMLPLTGYPADDFTAGRIHVASLTVPADRPMVRDSVMTAIQRRQGFEIEYRITHREGREKWVLVRGRPVHDETGALRFLEGLAIDVTALKLAELEKLAFERNLQETQKLESLGVMAGGIAHDFNNILTVVLGNASLARMAMKPADPGQANLVQIETAARRAADLCAQMLAYAGKGRTSVGRIDLSALVRDTTTMLEVSIRKSCKLSLQLAEGLPAIVGDSAQLNQIVMNLVINASDAIGERMGGKITVSTFARPADTALFQTALHRPKLPDGLYAGLEVTDNGCGMPPETIARIFEPFFTTKFSGRGLGLSAVLGIVQSHQGALFVESQPGLGSTFRLLLPTVAAVAPAKPAAPTPAVRPPLHGTVLVVDDEEAVRQITAAVLRRQGANVLLAADGSQALEIFQQQRDQIDLILLDLTMPGLSGEDVLRRLQQLEARQKIVIMSGYSEEETMQRCAVLGVVGFLRKPFELQTAVTKLQAFLS